MFLLSLTAINDVRNVLKKFIKTNFLAVCLDFNSFLYIKTAKSFFKREKNCRRGHLRPRQTISRMFKDFAAKRQIHFFVNNRKNVGREL
jgi:hypothetical protein